MTSKRRGGKKSAEESATESPIGPTVDLDAPAPIAAPPEQAPTSADDVRPGPEEPKSESPVADVAPPQVSEEAPLTPEAAPAAPAETHPEADDDDDPDDSDDLAAEASGLRERIEALLFSAPKPLRSAEIAEFCSVPRDDARASLRALRAEYRKRKSGLEIVKIDGRYQMRVRRGAEEAARLVSPTDISRDLLKTVTVIAFYQPMLQSELVEMVGSKAYDHVRELEERKLIRAAPYAQTKALATGMAFAEYFGLKTGRPEEVRKWVAKRLGKEPPGPRRTLTPALMAAEAALDPGFVAGRSVESAPLPEEAAQTPTPAGAIPEATAQTPGTDVSAEVTTAHAGLEEPGSESQPPAET